MEWDYKKIYFLFLILLAGCTSVNYVYKSVDNFPIIEVDKLNETPDIGIACTGPSGSQVIEMIKSAVSKYMGSEISFTPLRPDYLWRGHDRMDYFHVRSLHHQMHYVMVVEVGDPIIKRYVRHVGMSRGSFFQIFSIEWVDEYETQFTQRYRVSLYDIKKEELLAKSENYLSARQSSSEKYPKINGIPKYRVKAYIYSFLKKLESE
jgi:hypothetical protein